MSFELYYTSAASGLKPGSKGFCTVAQTQGLPLVIAERLEALSGYRYAFEPSTPQAAHNPSAFTHYVLTAGSKTYHVVARIAPAGFDYSGRANKFAHHVVLDGNELSVGGPAWLAEQPNFLATQWSSEPRLLPAGPSVPNGEQGPGACDYWQRVAGDAGWAEVLTKAFTADNHKPAYVIYPVGTDVLRLFVEAMALLPRDQRWRVSFNTYFTDLPAGIACLWRGVLEGTPAATEARRQMARATVIDLTVKQGAPPAIVNIAGPVVTAKRADESTLDPTEDAEVYPDAGDGDDTDIVTAPRAGVQKNLIRPTRRLGDLAPAVPIGTQGRIENESAADDGRPRSGLSRMPGSATHMPHTRSNRGYVLAILGLVALTAVAVAVIVVKLKPQNPLPDLMVNTAPTAVTRVSNSGDKPTSMTAATVTPGTQNAVAKVEPTTTQPATTQPMAQIETLLSPTTKPDANIRREVIFTKTSGMKYECSPSDEKVGRNIVACEKIELKSASNSLVSMQYKSPESYRLNENDNTIKPITGTGFKIPIEVTKGTEKDSITPEGNKPLRQLCVQWMLEHGKFKSSRGNNDNSQVNLVFKNSKNNAEFTTLDASGKPVEMDAGMYYGNPRLSSYADEIKKNINQMNAKWITGEQEPRLEISGKDGSGVNFAVYADVNSKSEIVFDLNKQMEGIQKRQRDSLETLETKLKDLQEDLDKKGKYHTDHGRYKLLDDNINALTRSLAELQGKTFSGKKEDVDKNTSDNNALIIQQRKSIGDLEKARNEVRYAMLENYDFGKYIAEKNIEKQNIENSVKTIKDDKGNMGKIIQNYKGDLFVVVFESEEGKPLSTIKIVSSK